MRKTLLKIGVGLTQLSKMGFLARRRGGRRSAILASILLLAAATVIVVGANAPVERLFNWTLTILRYELVLDTTMPESTWVQRDPTEFGISQDRLDTFRSAVGRYSSGCVIKDGALVFAWGEPNRNGDWGSATKPVVSTLLLFAVQEGLIKTVDESVVPFVSDFVGLDQEITFRQLANMTSGYTLPEAPGAAWAYNDYGSMLYFKAVFEGLYRSRLTDAGAAQSLLNASHRLGGLRFEDGDLFYIRKGAPRLNMSPRDFARIGVLWLQKGSWGGRQILDRLLFENHIRVGVPSDLPRTVGSPPHDPLGIGSLGGGNDHYAVGPGSYGFSLWFNDSYRLWPDLPDDAFQANGHKNREALTVIPSLGLVIAWLGGHKVAGDSETFNQPMNDALKLLLDALPPSGGATGNVTEVSKVSP